jgi:hypothetical protein
MTPKEENALRLEIEKLRRENELMKQLGTRKGFFDHYFKELPLSDKNIDAFEKTNNLYFELFGRFMYPNHEAFRVALHRYYQNQKK